MTPRRPPRPAKRLDSLKRRADAVLGVSEITILSDGRMYILGLNRELRALVDAVQREWRGRPSAAVPDEIRSLSRDNSHPS